MNEESNRTKFIKAIDQVLYESRRDYQYKSNKVKALKNINMSLDLKEVGNFIVLGEKTPTSLGGR